MDIRIGITQAPRELEIEVGDDVDRDELIAEVDAALGGSEGVLWLTDRKGRKVGIPAAKIAYVEVGAEADSHRVGFGIN